MTPLDPLASIMAGIEERRRRREAEAQAAAAAEQQRLDAVREESRRRLAAIAETELPQTSGPGLFGALRPPVNAALSGLATLGGKAMAEPLYLASLPERMLTQEPTGWEYGNMGILPVLGPRPTYDREEPTRTETALGALMAGPGAFPSEVVGGAIRGGLKGAELGGRYGAGVPGAMAGIGAGAFEGLFQGIARAGEGVAKAGIGIWDPKHLRELDEVGHSPTQGERLAVDLGLSEEAGGGIDLITGLAGGAMGLDLAGALPRRRARPTAARGAGAAEAAAAAPDFTSDIPFDEFDITPEDAAMLDLRRQEGTGSEGMLFQGLRVPTEPHAEPVLIGEHGARGGKMRPVYETELHRDAGGGEFRRLTDDTTAELTVTPDETAPGGALFELTRMDKKPGGEKASSRPIVSAAQAIAEAHGAELRTGHIISAPAISAIERAGDLTWDPKLAVYRGLRPGEKRLSGFDPSLTESEQAHVTNPEGLAPGLTAEKATAKLRAEAQRDLASRHPEAGSGSALLPAGAGAGAGAQRPGLPLGDRAAGGEGAVAGGAPDRLEHGGRPAPARGAPPAVRGVAPAAGDAGLAAQSVDPALLPPPPPVPMPWQQPRAAFGAGPVHAASVRQAFADGQAIPPDVLADYPDLVRAAERVGEPPPPPSPPDGPPGSGGGGSTGGGGGGPKGPPGPPPPPAGGTGGAGRGGSGRPPLPERAGNILLRKLNTSDDIKRTLVELSEFYDHFTPARRGVQSWEETTRLAQQAGLTMDDILATNNGQALNAHEALSARMLLVKKATDLERARAAMELNPTPEVKARFAHAMAETVAVQEAVAGFTAEAGRTLNIFKKVVGSAKDRAKAIRMVIERAGGEDKLVQIAEGLKGLETPDQVRAFLRDAIPATTWQQVFEAWINGLLSGPRTHMTNLMSNTTTNVLNLTEHGLAAAIGKLHGGERVSARETIARVLATPEGVKEGLVAFAKALRHDAEGYALDKVETTRRKAIPGLKGKLIRIPGRLLVAEDEFFKAIAYRQALNGLATADGLAKGFTRSRLARHIVDAKANPHLLSMRNGKTLAQMAADEAHYLTFTRELGSKGRKLQALVNDTPALKVLMPFVRTPANIFKHALERTLAAPFLREVRAQLKQGGRARDLALARMSLGSGIIALTVQQVLAGNLTGGYSRDLGERNVQKAAGFKPYSWRPPFSKEWYSYARLEPIASIVGMAADFANVGKDIPESTRTDIATRLAVIAAYNLQSKTYLNGFAKFAAAMHDPEQNAGYWVRDLAGSAVPVLSSQVASSGLPGTAYEGDPTIRETRDILDAWMNRIPGLKEKLYPSRDLYGEIERYGGSLGPDLFSPIFTGERSTDPARVELLRLGMSINPPDRRIDGRLITPEEQDKLEAVAGRRAKELVDGLMADPHWTGSDGKPPMDDEHKRLAIKAAFERAREEARTLVGLGTPDVFQLIEKESRMPQPNLQKLRELREQANKIDPTWKPTYVSQPRVQRQIRRRLDVLSGRRRRERLTPQQIEELDLMGPNAQEEGGKR